VGESDDTKTVEERGAGAESGLILALSSEALQGVRSRDCEQYVSGVQEEGIGGDLGLLAAGGCRAAQGRRRPRGIGGDLAVLLEELVEVVEEIVVDGSIAGSTSQAADERDLFSSA